MKIYKQNKNIKIKNINNSFNNRYKRQYSFCGIKFTVKNKEKIEFYKRKKEELLEKRYNERKRQLDELKKFRVGKDYILTCYVVTYNHSKTIARCLDSILEQKTNYPYLIKILDDASSDDTFDICLEYAKKYPDKIEYYYVSKNTKCKTLPAAIKNIKTKYYCIIDGDDSWCDETKIEQQLDILEQNPEYLLVGHNTLLNYTNKNSTTPLVKSLKNNVISINNYQYLHISSLIYRSSFHVLNVYKNMRMRDIFIYYAYLENGPCYYIDKTMSTYYIDGNGTWSKLPLEIQKYAISCLRPYACNKHSMFRYDDVYTKQVNKKTLYFIKKYFGKHIGWYLYYLVSRFKIYKKLKIKLWREINRIEKSYLPYSKKERKLIKFCEKEMFNV